MVPLGFCDFEMDLCYWESSALSTHTVAWSWTSGVTDSKFGPQVDHTTNSNLGKSLCIDLHRSARISNHGHVLHILYTGDNIKTGSEGL